MNKFLLFIVTLLLTLSSQGQQGVYIKVTKADSGETLPAATIQIKNIQKTLVADSNGIAYASLRPGRFHLIISYTGFIEKEFNLSIPFPGDTIRIAMEEDDEEEAIVLRSTRSSRTFRDIPTRIEFVAGEELDEKANMKPGDIRMVLNESTGIQTQQTSALSANASIRIQGLDGRYTQILRDGFPLYTGFSSGLGLLQTPPLDLQQFEVIKGSASTLYGGGAIAGLVNLISKTPKPERELKFMIDQTSAGGSNISGFFGKKFKKTGLTVFGSRNSNKAFDPSGTGLTAIPEFERWVFSPDLFYYPNEKTQIQLGISFTGEERRGGDIEFLDGNKPSGYVEFNNSDRFSTRFSWERRSGRSHLTLKNSLGHFHRMVEIPGYIFKGNQFSTFTEFTYSYNGEKTEWIGGLNIISDRFKEEIATQPDKRDYDDLAGGVFIQQNLSISEHIKIESGLRGDIVKDYGFVVLPRIAVLFRFSSQLSSRIGAGMGYKAPNIFTEESERLHYRNVLPVDKDQNKFEKSYGFNADLNYRASFSDTRWTFSINHLFFFTRINDPLLLRPDNNDFRFVNVKGHFDSRGMETNIRLGYGDLKLFMGYTFTRADLHEGNKKTENFLTPRHRLNTVLLYEQEDKWKLGLEAYYFSPQKLSDGTTGRSYWITGFMAERLFRKFSLYINFENFLDTRQTKFGNIYTGSMSDPVFRDIYAPLDGFVINGGIKMKF